MVDTLAISAETRFANAYTAIRMLADVGLHAHGYRTLTSKPGYHQTAIQALPTTLGIDSQTLIRLDKLRKQRNVTEYMLMKPLLLHASSKASVAGIRRVLHFVFGPAQLPGALRWRATTPVAYC
jgi:hypothetical protein